MDERRMELETRVVHAGAGGRAFMGANVTPIVRSTVFEVSTGTDYHDIRYGRLSTLPGQLEIASAIANVESAEAGLVTSSGMAAITTTLLATLAGGGHLLAQRPLYGATQKFAASELAKLGGSASFVDMRDPESWQSQLRSETRAFYVETISNPLLEVADHRRVVEFCRAHRLVSIIDNTFATPVNFRPIERGFDLVVHSATKYLNGHSDVVAGAVVGSQERVRSIKLWLDILGGTADPEACYLLRRGLKTLSLRVERQNATAQRLAEFFQAHHAVRRVLYPGLPSHPDHEHARALFAGFGGMIAIELFGGAARATRFAQAVRVATHSASLGGAETLVTIPATTSHAGLSPEARAAVGISDDLIRISVGIEHVADLLADFEQALASSESEAP